MIIKTTMLIALALLPSASRLVAAEDAVFVEKGTARTVREIGDKWSGKEGALVCGGTPGGDFLLMFPDGQDTHTRGQRENRK